MKKRLTLLRHAKSSWSDAGLDDRDRPLNKRGKRDAPMMGQRLLQKKTRPSLILTSPAKRARQTVRLIAREIGYPVEFLQTEPELYLAEPATLLDVIAQQDNSFNDIVLCGHNPGITELTNQLSGKAIGNVPTCGMVFLEADITGWDELGNARCTLEEFDYPKLSQS
jgi:phosphohistidine phosphatase